MNLVKRSSHDKKAGVKKKENISGGESMIQNEQKTLNIHGSGDAECYSVFIRK